MSDMTREEFKRGFIVGMAMNPLMVTKEAKSSGDRQTAFERAPLIAMTFEDFHILALTENMQTE